MERLQWTLELIDKMTGPGKSAAAAFEHLTDAQIEAVSAARRLTVAEGKAADALKEVQSGTRKLTADDLALVDATRKLRKEFGEADEAARGVLRATRRSITGSILEARIWTSLAQGIMRATKAVVEYTAKAAFAVGMKFFDAAVWAEDTRSSLGVLAGDEAKGNQEFDSIIATANKMGLAVQATTDAYKGLRAAQFGAEESQELIKMGADLQTVIGVQDDAIQSYLKAITQMKAKGKTSAEELMQIQEAVNLSQGAIFDALGEQLGKNREEIAKLQEQGKITSDQGIAAIKTATLGLVKASQAGEATEREVSKTLRGIVRLAKSAGETWYISVGERLMPAFNSVAEKVVETFKAFDKSGKFGAFTDAVVVTFTRFAAAIEDAWPRIEGIFGEGVEGMTDGMLQLSREFDDLLDKVLTVVEFVRDHWGVLTRTFAATTVAVGLMVVAIAGSTVIRAISNITGLVKDLSLAYRGAAAAKAALAAADGASKGAGAMRVAGAAIPDAGAGGKAMKARASGSGGKAMKAAAGVAGTGAAAGAARAAGAALAGVAATVGAATAMLAGVAAAAWQGYELWRENQDFDLFDVKLIVNKMAADIQALPDWISGLKEQVGTAAWTTGTVILDAVTGGLASRVGALLEAVASFGAAIVGALTNVGESFAATAWQVGVGIGDAMTGGLASTAANLAERAWSLGRTAVQGVKGAIGWNSPPTAFIELGKGAGMAFLDSLTKSLPPTISMGVGPANDVQPRQASAGLTVQQGAGYGGRGAQQVYNVAINVTVEGNAAAEDATSLAETIQVAVMPKVRAEIQRTLANAAGSAR